MEDVGEDLEIIYDQNILTKVMYREYVTDKIASIVNVIDDFRQGNLGVYDESVFCRMTTQDLVNWIVGHNADVFNHD